MSKVYLYSRVSTDSQSVAQQERTVYEWLANHNMNVDEVFTDEGISGGVSFKDRKLGKELLPKMQEGDLLIVSEISRLGRSMFDLSKLINEELRPRKLRLVVVSMSIDLRCDRMTAVDELLLSNFSFSAQLEKELISSRTRSALEVKKKQGVMLGANSPKWRDKYNNLTSKEKSEWKMKCASVKRERFQQSRNFLAFKKIIIKVFPESTESEDMKEWDWKSIRLKTANRDKVLELMQTTQELDDRVFRNFNFDNIDRCRKRIHPYLQSFKRSVLS